MSKKNKISSISLLEQINQSEIKIEIQPYFNLLNNLGSYLEDLPGLLNILEHFLSLGKNLKDLVITSDKEKLNFQLRTAQIIVDEKEKLIKYFPKIYIPDEIIEARLTGLYLHYSRYTSWFHNSYTQNIIYDTIIAHQHLFFLSGTGLSKQTDFSWSLAIRSIGEDTNKIILKKLNFLLEGKIDSKSFYVALSKLERDINLSEYTKTITTLKRFFKAAKNKRGQAKEQPTKNEHSKNSSNNLGRGTRQAKQSNEIYHSININADNADDYPMPDSFYTQTSKHLDITTNNKKDLDITEFCFDENEDIDMSNLGLHNNEFENGKTLILTDKTKVKTGCYSISKYRKKVNLQYNAIKKQETLSHNSFDRLGTYDLKILKQFVIYPLFQSSDNDAELIGILFELSLVTGRDIDMLFETSCVKSPPGPLTTIEHPIFIPEQSTIYLPAIFSMHKSSRISGSTEAAVPISKSIPIKLNKKLANKLRVVCNKRGTIPKKKKRKVFDSEYTIEVIRQKMINLLSTVNKIHGSVLTLSRIKEWLFHEASSYPRIGRMRACYLTGQINYYLQVHATYVSISIKSLREDYQHILKKYSQVLELEKNDFFYLERNHEFFKYSIGSKLTPTHSTMEKLVKELKPIASDKNTDAYAKKIMIYSGYWLGFESCHRVTHCFFPNIEDINMKKCFGVVSEKDFKNYHHSRPIIFTTNCIEQYSLYLSSYKLDVLTALMYLETNVDSASNSIFIPPKKRCAEQQQQSLHPNRFPMIKNKKLIEFNLTHFNRYFQSAFPLPPNAHRHFIASAAHEQRLPVELIMSMMGHVSLELSPWFDESRYIFSKYQMQVNKFMSKLTREVGFSNIK